MNFVALTFRETKRNHMRQRLLKPLQCFVLVKQSACPGQILHLIMAKRPRRNPARGPMAGAKTNKRCAHAYHSQKVRAGMGIRRSPTRVGTAAVPPDSRPIPSAHATSTSRVIMYYTILYTILRYYRFRKFDCIVLGEFCAAFAGIWGFRGSLI